MVDVKYKVDLSDLKAVRNFLPFSFAPIDIFCNFATKNIQS